MACTDGGLEKGTMPIGIASHARHGGRRKKKETPTPTGWLLLARIILGRRSNTDT
jgi:hypothetical protein